jgi:hypothetical protein
MELSLVLGQENKSTVPGNMPYFEYGTGKYVRFERIMGKRSKVKQSHYNP